MDDDTGTGLGAEDVPGSDYDLRAIMGRPVYPEHLTGARRRLWDAIEYEPHLYPGSAPMSCDECEEPMWVGPRQQQVLRSWQTSGVEHTKLCILCTAYLAAQEVDEGNEQDDGDGPLIIHMWHLGNPDGRPPHPGAARR